MGEETGREAGKDGEGSLRKYWKKKGGLALKGR